MIIDHIGVFLSGFTGDLFRTIGRISYPIFLYLFIDGFTKTKHPYRHVFDLFLFGIIAEPIHDLCFYGKVLETSRQNVMLTWGIAYVFIIIMSLIINNEKLDKLEKYIICSTLTIIISAAAVYTNFDYGLNTFVCALLCYICLKHNKKLLAISAICIVECIMFLESTFTPGCLLAVPIAYLYDDRIKCTYNKQFKYAFYAIYPIHLLIIFLARSIIL